MAAAMIGQHLGGIIADRFGRVTARLIYTTLLIVVSRAMSSHPDDSLDGRR